jgi:hypothetical protein
MSKNSILTFHHSTVGRLEEAKDVIAALDDVSRDHPGIQASIEEIQGTLTIESNWSFSMLYKNGPNRNAHRALLGMSVSLSLTLSSI